MAQATILLSYDGAASRALIARISQLVEHSPEFVEVFREAFGELSEAFRLNRIDLSAGRANEIRIRLEPTDRLRDLMAAFGAVDID
ncbi:hypothetical protein [Burkholderia vietnamiensis]|uniref:hypothetical protein n=1 Tax=Burkholderia vietnamiensis TaxID=60552 RepID=UPI0012D92576|nr:hypothetical protein [Burkholderia vietnamiensis]